MIVRILEEGQYDLDDEAAAKLGPLDAELGSAIEAGNEERFASALAAIIEDVCTSGRRLDDTAIVPSDLTIPHPSSTLEEVRTLLSSEPNEEA